MRGSGDVQFQMMQVRSAPVQSFGSVAILSPLFPMEQRTAIETVV